MKLRFLLMLSLVGLLATSLTPVALAAPVQQTVTCDQDYIVQADDWLSKLAGKFYNDIFAYPAIVVATNLAVTADDSYIGSNQTFAKAIGEFEGINFIDSQGSHIVSEIVDRLPNYGAELRLTRVKAQVMEVLRRDGVIDRLGESRVYGNVYEAAADQIPETPV